MQKITNVTPENWDQLIKRPVAAANLSALTSEVFDCIKKEGNAGLRKLNMLYDNYGGEIVPLPESEIRSAGDFLPEELKNAVRLAAANIELFHKAYMFSGKKVQVTPGVTCWKENRPVEKAGIYIPGGSAPLFSTVLMLGIPAKLAGCKEVILCTPAGMSGKIHPAILFAADLAGITRIYAAGGAQAIAAMCLGTETIPAVNKIFGPGNQYVTAAKQKALSLGTAIDMPAGPSELLIIADESCVPAFVAADLLSQAEHGPDSQVILLSDNEACLNNCIKEITRQLQLLPRKDIAAAALENSRAVLLPNMNACISFSNAYAPEHLILATERAADFTSLITNAGSVFLGNYSCESAGDYASGTNHTLPTNGFAKSYSGISVDSFMKSISFQHITPEGLANIGSSIEIMAEAEHLQAHKNAVTIRLKNSANV